MATVTPRDKEPGGLEAPPAKRAKRKAAAKSTKKKPGNKAPKPPGRPPWQPDFTRIEDWARQGLKDKEIAALCGITPQVFCEKKNELNELDVVLAKGRAKGVSMATTALWQNIAKKDQRALEFYLERVAGWKKTQVIEKGKDLSEFTDEELLALLDGDRQEGKR